MNYRRLGSCGLKLSELSLGSWVTFGKQLGTAGARECMALAYDQGVNFFDCAENYGNGEAERFLGEALRALEWRRASYVVSTKFYWGIHEGPNEKNTLNRKYLLQAIDGSLARLGLDYVDLVYCHRPDPATPVEETVWAMHDIVSAGKALYWGTSEWGAEAIAQAIDMAERHHLRKPVVEQPQYNLFWRERVECEYAPLTEKGLGLTTWSPLAFGLLSGKYNDGIPPGSRGTLAGYEFLRERLSDPARITAARQVGEMARELGATAAQLAIAWCLQNTRVSSVITGASSTAQLRENLQAAELAARLTPEVVQRLEAACQL